MPRHAPQHEQVRQNVDDGGRVELPVDADGQAFPGIFVDDVQHAELSAIVSAILDEVVGPDVVGIFRPQPHAGPVMEPEPAFLRLFERHLEPLPPPDPLHPFDVHRPPGGV